ncbi:GPI anchored serine-threonine rich family protein [Aspergillus lucknowensis]|uniref:Ser-Thr-rich glycosyl-phosphatidyl-inositol-anchored membrane family-domain-containing protein n=1 Tax=Aspergillus lucknowensis TaxID=176173 RepID=A0ABR4M4C6_9EURO
MRFTLVSSVLPLAVSVGAISVTEPKKNVDIDPSESFDVKWDSVQGDASSFDLHLVNNAVYPPIDKTIAHDVDTSDGSYTVDGIKGLADGPGYQISLLSNDPQNTGILAQSQQFNVTVSGSDSEASTPSSSAATSTTSTSSTSTSSPSTTTTSTTSASSTESSSAASPSSSPSDTSVSDTADGDAAGALGVPVGAVAGLLGGALLFNL